MGDLPARVAELEAALHAIMRVTDPGDLRSREAREAWEAVTPARRIAREVLGLEIGGHGAPPDAERRGVSPIVVAVGEVTGRYVFDGKPCDHGHIWTMDDESGRYQCPCGKLMSRIDR